MKRIISLCLLSAFLCTAAAPGFSQKRYGVPSKSGAVDTGSRFQTINAVSDGTGVMVEWQMAFETDNVGFSVIRMDGAETVVASPKLILGSTATAGSKRVTGGKYSFFDPHGTPGSVYSVQYFSLDGKTGTSTTTAVQTVSDLASAGYESSDELLSRSAQAKQRGSVMAERPQFPRALAAEILENRPEADSATHAWVATQPGVRIGVKSEGVYRVTKAELLAAGFDVNGDSSRWQLYREGVEHAISVGPNGDFIEFYGKGVDRQETDTATYFLISGPAAGKRIAEKVARPVAGTVTSPSYRQTVTYQPRSNYLNQVLNGDDENYFGTVIGSSGDSSFSFGLTGVDFAAENSSLTVAFQGYSYTAHNVNIKLNGETLTPATGNSRSPFSKVYVVPTSFLREGTNTLVFRSDVAADFSFLKSVTAQYLRKHAANQDRVKFYTDNYRLSHLRGFSSPNIRVYDMTNESEPVRWTNLNIVPEGATYTVRMPADRGRSMYAMNDSSYLAAASITPNDPASLKSSSNAANLVIISHKNWLNEAETWADYRRGQGVNVKVVEVSEIFDEFSYGDVSSLAIRDFLQYTDTNWQTAPGYVLILGDASYDPRNYEGFGYNNFVPTHIVETIFLETASDEFLADFNADGLAEMAVGRITARTPQMVTNALNKVIAFEQQAPTLQARGALFAYDAYDAGNNYDFQQISTRIRDQLPSGIPVTMIGRGDTPPAPNTPQTLLISSMNTGKLLVNYAGHGTPGAWVNAGFFASSIVPQLTNVNNQSIFTMLTCLNGFFHNPTTRSLAETLVEHTNGGAVAAWASTGETTPDVQEVMAKRFYQRIGQGLMPRLGDAVNDAKSVVQGGTDLRLSWALIGDPMLQLPVVNGGDRPARQAKSR